jgi:large subunit ribosomal protein L28
MPRQCAITGVRTRSGNKIRYRGKAKYLGGIGLKMTSRTKRKFNPNLQTVRALVEGKSVRIKVSAKAIRNGMITKPISRKHSYTRAQKQAQSA